MYDDFRNHYLFHVETLVAKLSFHAHHNTTITNLLSAFFAMLIPKDIQRTMQDMLMSATDRKVN